MSAHAISWAMRQEGDTLSAFLLLLLADQAGDDGLVQTTQTSLAAKARTTAPTVTRKLRRLEEAGLLESCSVRRSDGANGSKLYMLACQYESLEELVEKESLSEHAEDRARAAWIVDVLRPHLSVRQGPHPTVRQGPNGFDLDLDLDLALDPDPPTPSLFPREEGGSVGRKGSRRRDVVFEALVDVTKPNLAAERTKVNKALKQIRESSPLQNDVLADEIRRRAAIWPTHYTLTLTPTALATHWNRLADVGPIRERVTPEQLLAEGLE